MKEIEISSEESAVLEKVKRPTNRMIIDVNENIDILANPYGSWFGHIGAMAEGEEWPSWVGNPMIPLCQINTSELKVLPDAISDLALICVWIGTTLNWSSGKPRGIGWQIRCYKSLKNLIPIKGIFKQLHRETVIGRIRTVLKLFTLFFKDQTPPKVAPIKWELVNDYPDEIYVKDLLTAAEYKIYFDLSASSRFDFHWVDDSKLGGWPRLVEGQEVFLPPSSIDYVFQIASFPELNWKWTDPGAYGYFGRSKTDQNEWVFEYRSY